MLLSENIRKCREKTGMSQMQLAKTVGVDQSAICKIEKGLIIPTVVLVDEIAHSLNVTIDELMHGESA